MNKELKYQELVSLRKHCFDCNVFGMRNQSETKSDTDSIGKWSDWQGNLNAEIIVIGQDWGSFESWVNYKGEDSITSTTNKTLIELFKIIGYDIGTVLSPNKSALLFFTNAVLCLKAGKMSDTVPKQCFANCSTKFLKPLIEIINPKIIITLGTSSYDSVIRLYSTKDRKIKYEPLKNVAGKEPIELLKSGLKLFPFFHCGGLGLMNRKREIQIEDWKNLKGYIEKNLNRHNKEKGKFIDNLKLTDLPMAEDWQNIEIFSLTFNSKQYIDRNNKAEEILKNIDEEYWAKGSITDKWTIDDLRFSLFDFYKQNRFSVTNPPKYKDLQLIKSIVLRLNLILYNELWERQN